ncbi:MAG TPA: YciI family protein [Gammaproteobacteria bacterium]|nr:YciI family protein [Gammaproteobacteria bacterium]
MLIAISNYTTSLEQVDLHRDVHIEYLNKLISTHKLLAAGRQTPPVGAVIIASNISLDEFKNILAEDPFCIEGVAEYKIFEFNPVLCDESFRRYLEAQTKHPG